MCVKNITFSSCIEYFCISGQLKIMNQSMQHTGKYTWWNFKLVYKSLELYLSKVDFDGTLNSLWNNFVDFIVQQHTRFLLICTRKKQSNEEQTREKTTEQCFSGKANPHAKIQLFLSTWKIGRKISGMFLPVASHTDVLRLITCLRDKPKNVCKEAILPAALFI